jgi:AraC-like DNA-binding protein
MHYLIPPEWEPYITTTPYVNASNIFPYAEGELIKGPFGSLLKRHSQEDGYRLWLHEIEVDRPFQLYLRFPQPTASLMYMLEGEFSYVYEGDNDVVTTSGFYYLSYMPRGNFPIGVQPGRHTMVQLDLSQQLLDGIAMKNIKMCEMWYNLCESSKDGFIEAACPLTEPVRNALRQLLHCDMEKEERLLHQYARFIDLWLLGFAHLNAGSLLKTPCGYRFTPEDYAAVVAAGNLQMENMDANLSMEQMASEVLLHPKKLNEGFKLMYGMTSQEWILEQKLQRAMQLLKTTNQTVLQVAIEVGYGSAATFIRSFKTRFGTTPLAARK